MILRRIALAIRRQDWFSVALEVLIVVFGVYVGIYVSDLQREQVTQQETRSYLVALQDDLRTDLARLDEIIALHQGLAEKRSSIAQLMADGVADETVIAPILFEVLTNLDLYFPNSSTYQTMRVSGYVTEIRDAKLRRSLATLFDRDYQRIGAFGKFRQDIFFIVEVTAEDHHFIADLSAPGHGRYRSMIDGDCRQAQIFGAEAGPAPFTGGRNVACTHPVTTARFVGEKILQVGKSALRANQAVDKGFSIRITRVVAVRSEHDERLFAIQKIGTLDERREVRAVIHV